jgi:stage II sporulation protein M
MGVLAVLLLMTPVGIILYLTFQVSAVGINPWLFVTVLVLPHGIFELPAAIIATAQAMRMGDIILSPPEQGGGVSGMIREVGYFLKLFVTVVAPLLLAAAFIERWVTPYLAVRFLSGG